ncbi:MAG: MFS transporter [Deltaproteobacteria bacterium]|nr:MFS transporter [Deltaproteobacteria bacterium]
MQEKGRAWLAGLSGMPRTVVALGLVSLFTDMSSEMIYPLMPLFLSSVLGAGALSLGVIEGVAESTSALLKGASGWWSDRVKRRKPLVLAGYSLSGAVRPLIGLAGAWPVVLALRFGDRVGKGLRSAPRDALIAGATDVSMRGRAYGFHRAMDHAGAVAGPLIAMALLSTGILSMRGVFLAAAIPSVIVVVLILAGVEEKKEAVGDGGLRAAPKATAPGQRADADRVEQPGARIGGRAALREMGPGYRKLLLAVLVFTLGNSTDAFLLLRLSELGVDAGQVAFIWAVHSLIRMGAAWFGGNLGDRLGHRNMILIGWLFYAVVYLAFAVVDHPWAAIAVFLAYGVYFGFTEPTEKALVSAMVPKKLLGTAFGFYHGAIGLAALPASLLFGAVWKLASVQAAFGVGAGLALAAALLLARVRPT